MVKLTEHIIFSLIAASFAVSCGTGAGRPDYEKQKIELPGVANARQIGGYVIGDKMVRPDVLLRSGNLSDAQDAAVETLAGDFKLHFIFDFRSSGEHSGAPDRYVPGAGNHHLPVLEDLITGLADNKAIVNLYKCQDDTGALLDAISTTEASAYLHSQYDSIVLNRTNQRSYAEFLDSLVALPQGKAALWHCSYGKDRCGWGTAFVLAALGAGRELVADDFALSNNGYQDRIDEVIAAARKAGLGPEVEANVYALIGVSREDFLSTWDSIERMYGSMDNYLRTALELTDEEKSVLREKFLIVR